MTNNFQIGIDQYGFESVDLLAFFKAITDTYPVAKCGLITKKLGILDRLRDLPDIDEVYDFSDASAGFIARGDDVAVYSPNGKRLFIHGRYYSDIECFVNKLSDILFASDGDIGITAFFSTKHGINSSHILVSAEDFDLIYDELYPDVDLNALCQAYKVSDAKVLILHGEPGTGKTSFIKHFVYSNDFNNIAYTKDLAAMESDHFWIQLHEDKPDLLILDDLDAELKRGEGNHIVDKLLTFSDGILINNTKIIITTNRPVKDVDPALIRPGRCFDCIELNALNREEANHIWTAVLGNQPDTLDFRENRISQAELMTKHAIVNGNYDRSYMKKGQDSLALRKPGF